MKRNINLWLNPGAHVSKLTDCPLFMCRRAQNLLLFLITINAFSVSFHLTHALDAFYPTKDWSEKNWDKIFIYIFNVLQNEDDDDGDNDTAKKKRKKRKSHYKTWVIFWCRRHRSARIELRPYFSICHLLGWSASFQKYHSNLDSGDDKQYGAWFLTGTFENRSILCRNRVHERLSMCSMYDLCINNWSKQRIVHKVPIQSTDSIDIHFPFFINASPHFGSFQWKKIAIAPHTAHCSTFNGKEL